MTKPVSNPTSTGGAGVHFEAKVAAQYLLALQSGMPGRGLPGAILTEVRVQQAPDGAPLDDIVLLGVDRTGVAARLDIQVKHKISFSPKDETFEQVCKEIASTVKQDGFYDRQHRMAIALARTSAKIEGPYQDVLTWARELSSAQTFFSRLDMQNVANDDMRRFVETFRGHLADAGAPASDGDIWKTLRRLLILPFDFAAHESASSELVLERASHCLTNEHAGRNLSLWDTLIERAQDMAKVGGSTNRAELEGFLLDRDFKLAGDRNYHAAMSVVAESARLALNRIDDKVGGVSLARQSRVDAVRDAFETARYVEIQGNAGVGKSGILRHFGRQQSEQGRLLVLAPGAVTPRGWTQMRSVLGFGGSCRDLLRELALEGEAYLLIDNIDRFTADEQTTVLDIVSEAADIPSIKILATGRRPIEPDATRWLDAARLKSYQPGPPVEIEALSEDELGELRTAAPALQPLLEDSHPARQVARNLFRLSRLATQTPDQDVPHSEVEMMRIWWRTGDGGDSSDDTDIRERRRVLAALGRHAAKTDAPFDAEPFSARAVQRLIDQRTLVEYGSDRVDFFHDVLREWAIASLIIEASDLSEILDLSLRATPVQVRAVELACAHAFDSDATGAAWAALLDKLSGGGVHSTWGRAALLSACRAGEFKTLPPVTETYLLDNEASKLRELIRLVRAVEVSPGKDIFREVVLPAGVTLPDFNVPAGPSWLRLILWTNANMARISAKAYSDISELYNDWCFAFLGNAPFRSVLNSWQYWWLEEIETARQAERFQDIRRPFGGALSHDEVDRLEEKARSSFLAFAAATPDKIKSYLSDLRTRQQVDKAIDSVMILARSLAAVAPQELSDLTCDYLFTDPSEDDEAGWGRRPGREAFRHVDNHFMPESPAKGPFLPLLDTHPEIGLALVRRMVDHAAERIGGADRELAFTIIWKGEVFEFTKLFTYGWVGPSTAGHALTCALWALEAWGHARLEKGDDPEAVLSDIIGESGALAALACVAVHLVISNIKECQTAGAPFLGCPELLSFDMERPVRQSVSGIDFFGGAFDQETGITKSAREELLSKLSRRKSLMDLIGWIAINGEDSAKAAIGQQLEVAQNRLPPVERDDSLKSPALAAQHTLNLLNEEHWVPLEQNGQSVRQYQSPADEQAHFDHLNADRIDAMSDEQLRFAIMAAVHRPEQSSGAFARRAVELVRRESCSSDTEDDGKAWVADEAIVNAALIAMRDGDAQLKREQLDWARSVFALYLNPPDGRTYGVSMSRAGTAFLGLVYSLTNPPTRQDCEVLFRAQFSPHDMQTEIAEAALKALNERDPRLARSLIRCRLRSRIFARHSHVAGDDVREANERELERELNELIESELDWMFASGGEPDWPQLPAPNVRVRTGIRIGGGRDLGNVKPKEAPSQRRFDFDADHAAIWLNAARAVLEREDRDWLFDLANAYTDWTFEANGEGHDHDDRLESGPRAWSNAIAVIAADGFNPKTGESRVVHFRQRLVALPEGRFFGLMSDYLFELDVRYFNDQEEPAEGFAAERRKVTARLLASRDLQRHVEQRRSSISLELGPALGRVLFATHNLAGPPTCYLYEKAIGRTGPFLSMLADVAREAPCYFAAFSILSFVEVAPHLDQLELVLTAADAWRSQFPTQTEFWIGQGIGHRVIAYFEHLLELDKSNQLNANQMMVMDRIVAHLVSLGLSEAAQFEDRWN